MSAASQTWSVGQHVYLGPYRSFNCMTSLSSFPSTNNHTVRSIILCANSIVSANIPLTLAFPSVWIYCQLKGGNPVHHIPIVRKFCSPGHISFGLNIYLAMKFCAFFRYLNGMDPFFIFSFQNIDIHFWLKCPAYLHLRVQVRSCHEHSLNLLWAYRRMCSPQESETSEQWAYIFCDPLQALFSNMDESRDCNCH